MVTNWAGNYTYRAARIVRPESVEELQRVVADATAVRALGSGHSFTALPDTSGDLVRLDGLPARIDVDSQQRCVSVGAGTRYGDLTPELHAQGWALPNQASLPHISVAGAVSTGTHGSGDGNQPLSSSVRAVDLVGPDGEVRTVRRGDPGFEGSVVALGALGIVSRLELDLEPDFEVLSGQYTDLAWDVLDEHFEDVMASAYSVSLFTKWGPSVDQVWLKSRDTTLPEELFGAPRAARTLHMLDGAPPEAVTEQGVPGPWHDRLPHFRLAFTPSRGAELQSEYFLPRDAARDAIAAMRRLEPLLAPVLQISEVRTIAADSQWLSGACGRDTVTVHFTWEMDEPGVAAAMPEVERALLPLGARPHWGKCSAAGVADLWSAFPHLRDFGALRAEVDPHGKFLNPLLAALLEEQQVAR